MKAHHTQWLVTIVISFVSFLHSYAQCYEGNCTNGWGSYKFDSGDKYTGEWSNGYRTGLGAYDWSNGAFYYGYFQDGKLEGDGFYIGLDSTEDQIGTFHNGVLSYKKTFPSTGCVLGNCTDGSGVYLWDDNDIYIGEYRNGARTGYGRYDWEDGSYYIGYFTDGKLDGQGEYHPKGKDVMKGTFVLGEFQGSTSTSSASSTPSTYASSTASYPDRHINEADLCSVIKNVVADYQNNFENIKQTKDLSDSYGETWKATWKMSGTTEAVVSTPLLSGHNTWYNVIYESTTYASARAKYDDYVSTMKNCTTNCCTLLSDSHDYKGDSYSSYLTYWFALSVKDGYSADLKDMQIEIELTQKILDEGWEVVARVVDFDEY